MKKHLLLLAACALVASACNRTSNDPNAFSINTITVEDSIQFPPELVEEWMTEDVAHYYSEVDAPVTGNEELRDNIIAWISSLLNPNYAGDSQDVKAMVEFDKDEFLTHEVETPQCAYQNNVKFQQENDRYITYFCESWLYMGGAHGTSYKEGATFSKATGERFTFSMLKDPESLCDQIKDALEKQYFLPLLEGTEVTFEDAVYSEVAESFPLPTAEPWIQNDSVYFVYEDYEIAAYVFGMPECGIPYTQLKDALTDEGKAFFEPVKKQ